MTRLTDEELARLHRLELEAEAAADRDADPYQQGKAEGIRQAIALLSASPAPSQEPRPDVAELVKEARELKAFLDGSGDLDGYSYGMRPASQPNFWWRRHLGRIDRLADALSAPPRMDREKVETLKKLASELNAEAERMELDGTWGASHINIRRKRADAILALVGEG